jgi:hypothetical protein
MTTTITQRAELAHRTSAGLHVYLFWNEPRSRVTVRVLDTRGDDSFEFAVDGRHALDAFNHPYAYAARADTADLGAPIDRPTTSHDSSSDSQDVTINPWRTNHARTDR